MKNYSYKILVNGNTFKIVQAPNEQDAYDFAEKDWNALNASTFCDQAIGIVELVGFQR